MITALWRGRIASGRQLIAGRAVLLAGGRIIDIVEDDAIPAGALRYDLGGGILVPGFIDTQVNGGGGVLFNDSPTAATIARIGAAHRRFGTTGFLPTLISDDLAVIDRALRATEAAIDAGVPGVLGIHIEGPFLNSRRHGIHNPQKFRALDREAIRLLTSLQRGRTVVTLAPETVGAETIGELTAAGVVVAAGHTDATYEQMVAGLAAGVTGFTHLFNAMSPMTARAPGAVGAALENQQAWCGIIVDGHHVHPGVLRNALHSRPVERFMLVTDAMPPVGTNERAFLLQGRKVRVVDGVCIDETGTLAGSVLDMATAVRNTVDQLALPLPVAVELASTAPAAFLGLSGERGRIARGLAADLVLLDENLRVRETWIAGVAAGAPA